MNATNAKLEELLELTKEAQAIKGFPHEKLELLLEEAPANTLLLLDGEVYRRRQDGNWRALEELTTEGSSYMTYETWASYSPKEMANLLIFEGTPLQVLFMPTTSD